MAEAMARSGDADIAVETFGDPNDPPVLLVMGAMASMLWWPDGFCTMLAARGRHVIRYDNRDTGLSTTWPVGAPGYSFTDMADDAVAVIGAFGLDAAHVVGMSMGGMIAQQIALRRPERVLTLTAISTSPLGMEGLPPPTDAYAKHSESAEAVDWGERASVIDYMVRDCRALAGVGHPHDAATARRLVERDFDRARSFASATNHFLLAGGEDGPQAKAADIDMPLLVIHGTDDPLFPVAHGEAFADVVPGARLLPISGGGHELHEDDWPVMIDAIVAHTKGASAQPRPKLL